ncbi:PKD domain-containing protein [Bacteroidota bacterium]
MKKQITIIPLCILITLFTINYLAKIADPKKDINPLPTDGIANEEEIEHNKRTEWFEEMHAANEGVNWRQMDLEYRLAKANKSSEIIRKRKLYRSTTKYSSIANGSLFGSWNEIGSTNLAGRIICTDYYKSSNEIYAASASGNIWKASMVYNNWQSLNDHFAIDGIHSFRVIPNGNSIRLLVSNRKYSTDGFYFSDDEGVSWKTATGLPFKTQGFAYRMVVANDNLKSIYIIGVCKNPQNNSDAVAVFVSINKGNSFSLIKCYDISTYGVIDYYDIWTDPNGTGKVFLIQKTKIYEILNRNSVVLKGSINPGFTVARSRLTGNERNGSALLYASAIKNGLTYFYKSTNNGINWSFRDSISNTPFGINSFNCSVKNPNNVYYGCMNLYKSYNSAKNWVVVNNWGEYYQNPANKLHADIVGVNVFLDQNNNEFCLASTDGGIYKSIDSFQHVQNISLSGLNVSQYYSILTNGTNVERIHAGSQDQGYQISNINSTGSKMFTQIVAGDYGHLVSKDKTSSLWMVYPGAIYYYPNINTYTCRAKSLQLSNAVWMSPLMADPLYSNTVYVGGGTKSTGTHIYKVEDDGSSLNMNELSYDFSNGANTKITAMASSPLYPELWYVMTNKGDFFYTSNRGNSWVKKSSSFGNPGHYIYGACILPSPKYLSRVYIAGSGYSNPPVMVSYNYGTSFVSMTQGLPNTLVYELAATPDEKYIFAATELGPFVFITSLQQWFDMSDQIAPDQIYWSVEYIKQKKSVRFASYGRGIWEFTISDSLVPKPIALFDYTINGYQVSFKNLSQNALYYHWDFGNGDTSNLKEPVYEFKKDGEYDVSLTAYGASSKNQTLSKTISIANQPIADFTFSTNELEVEFQNTSINADSLFWDFGNGDTSKDSIPAITYQMEGTFAVKLYAINKFGMDSIVKEVYVTTLPVADFDYKVEYDKVLFTDKSKNTDSVIWYFENNDSSLLHNPVRSYSQVGNYEVSLLAFNAIGCDTITKTIEINFKPTADFTYVILEREVTFTNRSAHATSYYWEFGNGEISTLENPKKSYVNNNSYTITLICFNPYSADTLQQQIDITSKPIAVFSFSLKVNDIQFKNESIDADNYYWEFGDGNISHDANPLHTYLDGGTYTIKLTASNPFGESIYSKTVNVTVSINERPVKRNVINIYPNPGHDYIVLEINNSLTEETFQFEIYDIKGKLIHSNHSELNGISKRATINIRDYDPGVYLIRFICNQKEEVRRFVKY